jgi:nicotinate-nucleotide--dimethylbenzimidazole phosphoribosyltransferase
VVVDIRAAALAKIAAKTKPIGSLGRIEDLAVQLCVLQNTLNPAAEPARVLVFAADHGLAAAGVSLYPASVTAQMMQNFAAGGAAINVLARGIGASLEAIDVGVASDLQHISGIVHAKVARGSGNIALGAAMSQTELAQALEVGRAACKRARAAQVNVLILGEMGIGNTSSSAALLCALLAKPAHEIVGAGTGVSGEQLAHKTALVQQAVDRLPQPASTLEILRELGGFEIAALVGAILQAHAENICVLVDGFIVSAAACVALRLLAESGAQTPARHLVFAHQSAERGHAAALAAMQARPLLELDLRLGEGSGAALAYPLVRSAAAIMCDMASFESAGVDQAQ